MSEEVAISEVSSINGASLNTHSAKEVPQDQETSEKTGDPGQGSTTAGAVSSTSGSSLLSTLPPVAPSVDDISWDLGHYETGEAKNLLSNISEEQMSKLDEVLSLDEVQRFLEQTGSNAFPSQMSEFPPPAATPASSAGDQATPITVPEKSEDDKGKADNIFTSSSEPFKLEGLDLDDEAAHEIIKKGIREQDVAKIAVSFSDHAYALAPNKENRSSSASLAMATPSPSSSTASPAATTPTSTPRKSSRIAKRKGVPLEEAAKPEEDKGETEEDKGETEEEGKSADTEEETTQTEDSEDTRKTEDSEDARKTEDSEDATKGTSGEEQTKGKGRGKRRAQATPRPTRRSTRISEHEQREMAEKIRQENLRKEREHIDAMQKAKEEETMKAEQLEKEKLEKELLPPAEKVEKDSQTEERPVTEPEAAPDVPVPPKGAGRGRGRGRKVGVKPEVKPGAKAVTKEIQSPVLKKAKGRGRGRGKKAAGTDESETVSQSQSSSTEDDVPLRTLTKKGRKTPKKGAKNASPAEITDSETSGKKKDTAAPQVSKPGDSTPVQKAKAEDAEESGSEVKTAEVKAPEKKVNEDQKPKAAATRHRRSTGRKSESEIQALSLASDLFKPDAVIVHQQDVLKGRSSTGEASQADEDSDGGMSYEDDENDSDWDAGEKANKVWCICKKPHGNSDSKGKRRKEFMICCDKCQGWFHGRCVGISKARGKEMEKNNEEYVCPVCTAEKLKGQSGEDQADSSVKTESETKMEVAEACDSKGDVKVKTEEQEGCGTANTDSKNTTEDHGELSQQSDTKTNVEPNNPGSADTAEDASDKSKDVKTPVKTEERSFLSAISGMSESVSSASDNPKSDLKPKAEKPAVKVEKTKESKKHVKGEKKEMKSYGEKIDRTLAEIRRKAAQVLEERKKKRFKGLGDHKRTFERCIVEGCGQESRPDSVYCSDQCIEKYSTDSLDIIRAERERNQGHRRSLSDGAKKVAAKVVVMERRTGRVLTGPSAPSESNLGDWLRNHPSFEVLRPAHASHKITTSFYRKDRGDRDHKDSKHSSSHHSTSSSHHHPTSSAHHHSGSAHRHSGSTHHPSSSSQHSSSSGQSHASSSRDDSGPDPVRLNVRKSLRDVLAHRANEADDIMLSNSEIKKIALSIEEELYNLFQETATKYKAKYRSLIFNIKDLKNKGLFRKILTNQIKAQKLVRMTPEELASKELAKWREMENKHTLEMIELAEKEAQEDAGKQHVTKKTHKGEQQVADEDLSSLVNVEATEEKKPKLTSPVALPASFPGDFLSSLIVDTTEQHRMHLFDLNCKVCTGKVAPPSTEEPPVKKVKVARTISKDSTERLSVEKKEEPLMDAVVEEKEVKEVLKVIEKVKAGEELAASSVADSTSVTVRSPDSALQSGLEITPRDMSVGVPALWKGFIHMQDLARFVTSAHRVSGPTQHLILPDCIQLCGRIAPEQVWDYLARIKKAGSKDICVIRFDPAVGEEKSSYVQLYSYLNSRSRCGVCGNNSKHIKDLYIVPLAAHCKIPSILMPFDGPGLQDNRPHMLLGIVVKPKLKRPSELGPPEAAAKPFIAEGPTQVKRMKQPSKPITPRKSVSDPRKPNPLDPRERLKGAVTPAKASPLLKEEASSDEQSYTPPENTPPGSAETPKPKIHDPIVQEYGQVDLKKLEEDVQTSQTEEKPMAVVEEDEPYDPEDMEGILLKPGMRASNVTATTTESTPPSKTTTDTADAKPKDQKSLLRDLTRRVEEQKRQIELRKLAVASESKAVTTTSTEPVSLAPTLSTILTTLKAANMSLLEKTAATTTTQPQPAPKPAASSGTNWDEIIKANLATLSSPATTTPSSTGVEEKGTSKAETDKKIKEMKDSPKVPTDPKQDKDQKVSEKGSSSSQKAAKEEKKSSESSKVKPESSKGSDRKKSTDSPARRESHRSSSSPDRRRSRHSPKGRDSSSRRRSRSPGRRRDEHRGSSSRRRSRSSDRRSSDRRSGDSRSSSHRSRHSERDRDHGRSGTDSRSPRDKPRSSRDDRDRRSSSDKHSDKRSSSREKSARDSISSTSTSTIATDKKPQTVKEVEDTAAKAENSTGSAPAATPVLPEVSESIALAKPVEAAPKQNKTESEILDELVLGKPTVPDCSSKTEGQAVAVEAKETKDDVPVDVNVANLPAIPGLGFETTIPMSEISDILKNISKVTSSANSDTSAVSAESVVSSSVPTIISAMQSNSPAPVSSPKTSFQPLQEGTALSSSADSVNTSTFGVTPTEGKGDVDYRKQTVTMAGPVIAPPSVTLSGQFGQPDSSLPSAVFADQAPTPSQGLTGSSKDVDLRRGDVVPEVPAVFMSIEDKDMRRKPPEPVLSLGSGDSDMRIGSGDKDMRVRPADISGTGDRPAFHGQPLNRNPGTGPFEQRPQGRVGSPAPPSQAACKPLQPPPLPPLLLSKKVFTGDKDDRVAPPPGPAGEEKLILQPPSGPRPTKAPGEFGPPGVPQGPLGRDVVRPPGRSKFPHEINWQQFPPGRFPEPHGPPNPMDNPSGGAGAPSVTSAQAVQGILPPPPQPLIPQAVQPRDPTAPDFSESGPLDPMASSQDNRPIPQQQFGQRPHPAGVQLRFAAPGQILPRGPSELHAPGANDFIRHPTRPHGNAPGANDFMRHPSGRPRGPVPGNRMMLGYRGRLPRPPPPPPPGRGMMRPRGPRPHMPRHPRGRGMGW